MITDSCLLITEKGSYGGYDDGWNGNNSYNPGGRAEGVHNMMQSSFYQNCVQMYNNTNGGYNPLGFGLGGSGGSPMSFSQIMAAVDMTQFGASGTNDYSGSASNGSINYIDETHQNSDGSTSSLWGEEHCGNSVNDEWSIFSLANKNASGDMKVISGYAQGPNSGDITGVFSNIWNSDFVRNYIPDLISLSGDFTSVPGFGGGATIQLNLLTRGPDAGLFFTNSKVIGGGVGVDYSLNLGIGQFTGPVNNITRNSLLGNGFNVGAGDGVGGNIWGSISNDNSLRWIGGKAGLGYTYGVIVSSTTTYMGLPDDY